MCNYITLRANGDEIVIKVNDVQSFIDEIKWCESCKLYHINHDIVGWDKGYVNLLEDLYKLEVKE